MLGGIEGQFRQLYTEGPYGFFETTVESRLGDWIREQEENGGIMWCALANVTWEHPVHGKVTYSFRAAGDLVAAIRKSGDYLHWYCSGPDGVVADNIALAMSNCGWSFQVYPSGVDYR